MRLCPRHYDHLEEVVSGRLLPLDDEGQASLVCLACGATVDVTVSARLFEGDGPPSQYIADFCRDCAYNLGQDLQIMNGRPLRRAWRAENAAEPPEGPWGNLPPGKAA